MRMSLLLVAVAAGCGGSSDGVEMKEVISDDAFDAFPVGWKTSGGSPGQDFGTQTEIGNPPPAVWISRDVRALYLQPFTFTAQTLEARVDAYVRLEDDGRQELQLSLLPDEFADAPLAYVTLRRVNNYADGLPVPGYPQGPSFEAECAFGPPTPQAVRKPLAAVADGVMLGLYIVIDEAGARCGVGDLDIVADPAVTTMTSPILLDLAAVRDDYGQGFLFLDNLVLSRGPQ